MPGIFVAIACILELHGFEDGLGQLLHEQRHAVGLAEDLFEEVRGQSLAAGKARHHGAALRPRELAERERGDVAMVRPVRLKLRPMGEDNEERNVPRSMNHQVHRFQGGGIGPVDILEEDHRRLFARGGLHRVRERAQRLVLEFLRGHRNGPVTRLAGNGEHRGDEPQILARAPEMADKERFELVELGVGRLLSPELQDSFVVIDDGKERAVDVVGRAVEPQACRVVFLQAAAQLAEDAALADARLAGQKHHLPFTILRQIPALHQQADFVLAADEARQTAGTNRLEAALGNREPFDRPGRNRRGKTLDLMPAEVAKLEEIAEQSAGRGGDDDRIRLGQPLHPGGEVRRIADDRLLPRRAGAQQIANDDEAGGDADAQPQPLRRFQRADGIDQGQSGPDRPLGVVLMRLRIAEIDQNPVAHVFGDKAVEAGDRVGDAAVVGADHLAQILGIKPRRQRGRADQIAEHHRDLAPLGIGGLWRQGDGRPIGRPLHPCRRQLRDGAQKLLAVAERNTELFEVRLGEIAEHGAVDIGPGEGVPVLGEPEPFQQFGDSVHRAAPYSRRSHPPAWRSRRKEPTDRDPPRRRRVHPRHADAKRA